jgi:hypothetical protein
MRIVFLNILVLLLVLSTSCTKDKAILPDIPEPTTPSDFIQMRFVFVNQGDSAMNTINLESSFYRIHLNTSTIHYKNYPTILPHDSILHYSDSSKVGSQKNLTLNSAG